MGGRIGGELEADAAHGRAAPALALLRIAATDMASAAGRLRGQSQARAAAHAADGHGGDLPAAADQRAAPGASHLPVFAAERGGFAAGPGVERGHHLRADAARIHVFGCNSGLAQPIRTGVAVVEHAGQRLLRGGPAEPRYVAAGRRSSTPIRGRSSPAWPSRACWRSTRIAISMDGRGRALDNVFIERLWWSVKYENVYLQGYETVRSLEAGLRQYFDFYCRRRPHQSLDNRTPWEVYRTGRRQENNKSCGAKILAYGRLRLENLLTKDKIYWRHLRPRDTCGGVAGR